MTHEEFIQMVISTPHPLDGLDGFTDPKEKEVFEATVLDNLFRPSKLMERLKR